MAGMMIKKIKSYFSLIFCHRCFYDSIGGKYVNMYVDCYGDLYMKDGRWAFFSVHKGNVYSEEEK